MNWDRARVPRADAPVPPTHDHAKLVARYARELRSMSTRDVERIAKDSRNNAAHRAAAWRDLGWRR